MSYSAVLNPFYCCFSLFFFSRSLSPPSSALFYTILFSCLLSIKMNESIQWAIASWSPAGSCVHCAVVPSVGRDTSRQGAAPMPPNKSLVTYRGLMSIRLLLNAYLQLQAIKVMRLLMTNFSNNSVILLWLECVQSRNKTIGDILKKKKKKNFCLGHKRRKGKQIKADGDSCLVRCPTVAAAPGWAHLLAFFPDSCYWASVPMIA